MSGSSFGIFSTSTFLFRPKLHFESKFSTFFQKYLGEKLFRCQKRVDIALRRGPRRSGLWKTLALTTRAVRKIKRTLWRIFNRRRKWSEQVADASFRLVVGFANIGMPTNQNKPHQVVGVNTLPDSV